MHTCRLSLLGIYPPHHTIRWLVASGQRCLHSFRSASNGMLRVVRDYNIITTALKNSADYDNNDKLTICYYGFLISLFANSRREYASVKSGNTKNRKKGTTSAVQRVSPNEIFTQIGRVRASLLRAVADGGRATGGRRSQSLFRRRCLLVGLSVCRSDRVGRVCVCFQYGFRSSIFVSHA